MNFPGKEWGSPLSKSSELQNFPTEACSAAALMAQCSRSRSFHAGIGARRRKGPTQKIKRDAVAHFWGAFFVDSCAHGGALQLFPLLGRGPRLHIGGRSRRKGPTLKRDAVGRLWRTFFGSIRGLVHNGTKVLRPPPRRSCYSFPNARAPNFTQKKKKNPDSLTGGSALIGFSLIKNLPSVIICPHSRNEKVHQGTYSASSFDLQHGPLRVEHCPRRLYKWGQ